MEHAIPQPNDCLLVVDDDDLDRRTIRRVLGRCYVLLEAATGVQAEGLLRSRSIDCVLLDYHIPGTDALAFLEMCVQAQLPVVMLTGAGNEALAVEALKRGAQDYLTKDQMTQDALKRTVAHAIQHAMMQRLLRNKQRELQDRQKQLEHERNFMSSVLQSQQDAVFVADPNATILQNSTAAEALLGYESGELVSRSVEVLFPPEQRQDMMQWLFQMLRGSTHAPHEVSLQSKSGEQIPVEFTWAPIRNADGTTISAVGVGRDLRAQKMAQAERETLHQQLVEVSRQTGMAEVATGILHNVGNVLNSVTTAASLALERVSQSHVVDLAKAAALLDTHRDDLGTFLTSDPQGQHLPPFLHHLAQHLLDERDTLLKHLQVVNDKVDHIKEIVTLQQSYARVSGVIEPLALATLMDDALQTHDDSFFQHEVDVVRAYAELPLVLTDRHKVLQILVNLISNAKHALLAADSTPKQLTVRVRAEDAEQVVLEVVDNGVGIEPANLTRIFQHGFTTKVDGHGFGLHSSALMAQELGGALTAYSAGVGQGAMFRLALPMQEARVCMV